MEPCCGAAIVGLLLKASTWWTIGVGVAAALFVGAFVGNLFSGRAARARARPSVYAIIQRHLDDERAEDDR